jgi:hypothetical protein
LILKFFVLLVNDRSSRLILILQQIILFKDIVTLSAGILKECLIRKLILKIKGISSGLDNESLAGADPCQLLKVLFVLELPDLHEVLDLAPDIHLIVNLFATKIKG